MSKQLAFGGKGLSIVGGSYVKQKKGSDTGVILDIKFNSKSYSPEKYQIRWDSGLVNWVNAKKVIPCDY
jgi:hypothetical protein